MGFNQVDDETYSGKSRDHLMPVGSSDAKVSNNTPSIHDVEPSGPSVGHAEADVSYEAVRDSDESFLIVVMGVAGTGKTTLAKSLVDRLNSIPYIEGDDLHPPESIRKMSSGVPLNDADREPWLKLIRKTAEETISRQQQDSESRQLDNKPRGIIVTCSALKRYYRDILRGTYQPPSSQNVDRLEHHIKTVGVGGRLRTLFVYIKGDENILRERMKQRQGHYMKPEMLDSQLAALESPEGEDEVVIVSLDNTTDGQVEETLRGLKGLGVFQ